MSDLFPTVLTRLLSGALPAKPASRTKVFPSDTRRSSPRCATGCTYGHCSLVAEPWFTRVLSLERKRSERSRQPFLLLLVDIAKVGVVNGGLDWLTHQVHTALASYTRETDITGWSRDGAVIGTIFTELGKVQSLQMSVNSVVAKTVAALEQHLGPEKSAKVEISCHVFPDDWSIKKPGGSADASLYPDLTQHREADWMHSGGKRMIDLLGSGLALLILLPVFLLIAVMIKLTSKGPVLFRQNRLGQFGEPFAFLKFRSMYVSNDNDIHKQYVKKLIAGKLDGQNDGVFKITNDPRITPFGRFLRKASLDELPQFWNVFLGQMSLVGPRPPLPYEVEIYDLWHRRRLLEAKPGITGLWQVNGRSHTCFDDMVRLDLHYIKSCSLWLDLKILLQTPRAVLAGDGAY